MASRSPAARQQPIWDITKPTDWYRRGMEDTVPVSDKSRMLYVAHYLLPHVPWRFLPTGDE